MTSSNSVILVFFSYKNFMWDLASVLFCAPFSVKLVFINILVKKLDLKFSNFMTLELPLLLFWKTFKTTAAAFLRFLAFIPSPAFKFSLWKCTSQCFLVYLQTWAALNHRLILGIFITSVRNTVPISSNSPFPTPSSPSNHASFCLYGFASAGRFM